MIAFIFHSKIFLYWLYDNEENDIQLHIPSSQTISSTEKTIFNDEVESVRAEAEIMKRDGVNIIIALGHSGYDVDKKIAKEVAHVSLVIGGHTNTFLYNPPGITRAT